VKKISDRTSWHHFPWFMWNANGCDVLISRVKKNFPTFPLNTALEEVFAYISIPLWWICFR